MKALLQRVSSASVTVGDDRIAAIEKGLLVFVGVAADDTEEVARSLAQRAARLRIFADEHKPMNRSVLDVEGGILVVSQFTLTADVSKGRRPGFTTAASPSVAKPLYETFVDALKQLGASVQCGRFGADMQVELINDGPVTFWLEQ